MLKILMAMVSKNASKSSDAAKDAMMKQAKANDATAQYIVGIYYLALASAKTDLQEQDTLRNEALAWLLKSSQNDYLWAYLALAELSALKGHDQEAASWYQEFKQHSPNSATLPEQTFDFKETGKLVLSKFTQEILISATKRFDKPVATSLETNSVVLSK